jgi:hypothetical protein
MLHALTFLTEDSRDTGIVREKSRADRFFTKVNVQGPGIHEQ